MSRQDVIDSLRNSTPTSFVEKHLFDRIPALFKEDRELFVNWKRALADRISVDPACLTIVGSAATGVSLNPYKNFKTFNDTSDVDVAVTSQHYFTIAWRYLRLNQTRRLRVDRKTRDAWDEHVKRYVFWGTIATDRLLGVLPFGLDWMHACTKTAMEAPTEGRTINLRIYADFDSLRAYQVQSVKTLRDQE